MNATQRRNNEISRNRGTARRRNAETARKIASETSRQQREDAKIEAARLTAETGIKHRAWHGLHGWVAVTNDSIC